jgi:hypothetical protein
MPSTDQLRRSWPATAMPWHAGKANTMVVECFAWLLHKQFLQQQPHHSLARSGGTSVSHSGCISCEA